MRSASTLDQIRAEENGGGERGEGEEQAMYVWNYRLYKSQGFSDTIMSEGQNDVSRPHKHRPNARILK